MRPISLGDADIPQGLDEEVRTIDLYQTVQPVAIAQRNIGVAFMTAFRVRFSVIPFIKLENRTLCFSLYRDSDSVLRAQTWFDFVARFCPNTRYDNPVRSRSLYDHAAPGLCCFRSGRLL